MQRVNVPGVSTNGRPHVSDLSVVVEALRLAVAAPADFERAEWLPPGDPEHDALRDTPLNLAATWVVRAVRQERGWTCAVCLQPQADTVVQDGSTLVLVHAKCGARAPSVKEKQHAERLAKMQAHGFPPSTNEATQLVPDGGRVQKLEGR